MKQVTSIIRSEKGIAMPLVLIIMLVLILLGTALFAYSISDLNQAEWVESRSRAHYLARAGAESVAKSLLRNPEQITTIRDNIGVGESLEAGEIITFDTDFFDEGEEFVVEITRVEENKMQITGTGYADGVKQNVEVMLESLEPFDGLFYVYGREGGLLEFSNNMNNMEGDIVTGYGEVEPDDLDYYTGIITLNDFRTYPEPTAPGLEKSGEKNLNIDNDVKIIDDNPEHAYDSIDINNKEKLIIDSTTTSIEILVNTIDMHGGGELELKTNTDNDIIIEIKDDSKLEGDISIKGEGNVNIYVHPNKYLDIHTEEMLYDGKANLTVYLGDGSEIKLRNRSHFEGYIYGPNATASLWNSPDFTGSLIVNKLEAGGQEGKSGVGGPQSNISNKNEETGRIYNFKDLEEIDIVQHWIAYWSD